MKTLVVMVSVGNRGNLTKYTFNRLFLWANKHNYSCTLLKNDINYLDRSPHFIKLIVHKTYPHFDRYIIVDDDILLSSKSPGIDFIPNGIVSLCPDAVQTNTENKEITWTANTGFIVTDLVGMKLLEEAYNFGLYPYTCGDGTMKGIWGPFDQGITNYILFKNQAIEKLDERWNTQLVIQSYLNNGGWENWKKSRWRRIFFYISLLLPFSKTRNKMNSLFGLHLTMGVYPSFFNFIFK